MRNVISLEFSSIGQSIVPEIELSKYLLAASRIFDKIMSVKLLSSACNMMLESKAAINTMLFN